MKKIALLMLALVLVLSLVACGGKPVDNSDNSTGGNNNSTNTDDGDTDTEKLTMSITLAEGWREVETSNDSKQYNPPEEVIERDPFVYLRLTVEDNYRNYGEREYVEQRLDKEKIAFDTDDYDYSDITELTIGGHRAFEFTRTNKKEVGGERTRQTFIVKGEYVYCVVVEASKKEWNSLLADFDFMRDSLTLT